MSWAVMLRIGLDERDRLFTPRVMVWGRRGFGGGMLRVELRDAAGTVRRLTRRPLFASAFGRELRLPSFTIPNGVSADEALRWPWEIIVERDGSEIVHWRRYLEVSTILNPEREIALAGPPGELRPKAETEGWGPEAPWAERDSERLADVLVADGVISRAQRDQALRAHATNGKTLERTLIDEYCVDEQSLLRAYADVTGSEFVNVADYPIDEAALEAIPEDLVRRYGMIGIGYRDDLLTVAMSDPQHGQAGLAVEMAVAQRAYIVVATRDEILAALERRIPTDAA